MKKRIMSLVLVFIIILSGMPALNIRAIEEDLFDEHTVLNNIANQWLDTCSMIQVQCGVGLSKSVFDKVVEYEGDLAGISASKQLVYKLPVDTIKFDRSLTILASKDEESKFMVGSFSEIFRRANYQVLFEGVEDEKDELQCMDMNAEYLQGYRYSRPIPIEKLGEFLEKKEC